MEGPDKRAEVVREMFDRISPTYDLLNRVFSLNADVRWRRRAASDLPPGGLVLDLCCGTGDFAIAAAGQGRRIVGLDFSARMLRRARGKTALRGTPFVRGDALRLPFRDGCFDACTVGWGVRNFADTCQGLDEIARILRPRGLLRILEFSRPRSLWLKSAYEGYMKRVMAAVGDAVSGSRAYRYLSESVGSWHDEEGMIRLLDQCGFEADGIPLSGGICHLFRAARR